jgi:hypothetical protein
VKPEPPNLAGTPQDPLVSEKDRIFWSFQSPKAVEPPPMKHAYTVRYPIDALILSKARAERPSFFS